MTRRTVTAARRHAWSSVNHRSAEAARRRERATEQQVEQCVTAQADLSGWAPGELQEAWGK